MSTLDNPTHLTGQSSSTGIGAESELHIDLDGIAHVSAKATVDSEEVCMASEGDALAPQKSERDEEIVIHPKTETGDIGEGNTADSVSIERMDVGNTPPSAVLDTEDYSQVQHIVMVPERKHVDRRDVKSEPEQSMENDITLLTELGDNKPEQIAQDAVHEDKYSAGNHVGLDTMEKVSSQSETEGHLTAKQSAGMEFSVPIEQQDAVKGISEQILPDTNQVGGAGQEIVNKLITAESGAKQGVRESSVREEQEVVQDRSKEIISIEIQQREEGTGSVSEDKVNKRDYADEVTTADSIASEGVNYTELDGDDAEAPGENFLAGTAVMRIGSGKQATGGNPDNQIAHDNSGNGQDVNNPIIIDSGRSESEGISVSEKEDEEEEDLSEDEALEILDDELSVRCTSNAGTYLGHSVFELYPVPGLEIRDVGLIRMPMDTADAVKLMQHGYQAPYGKGEKTIVDTSFRKTHQIDAKDISFRNPGFERWLRRIVLPALLETLGLDEYQRARVKMQLYKLLIYETGGHFKQHRDSVKASGMFATLAVTLPSLHEGGELVLQHNQEKAVLDFSKSSEFNLAAAAWYSDVLHAVNPVRSGYRVVLTYNIISSNLSTEFSARRTGISGRLERAINCLDKVAYMLEHQYSGVEVNQLKGHDGYVVDHLRHAAEKLDYNLYLANISIYKSGYADCDEDDEDSEFRIDLNRFILVTGNFGSMKSASLDWEKEQLLPRECLEDRDPDSEHEEYTGNEGVTVDRKYYGVCAVLWPSESTFAIMGDSLDCTAILQQIIDESENNPANLMKLRSTARSLFHTGRMTWKDAMKAAKFLDDKTLITEAIAKSKQHELNEYSLTNLISELGGACDVIEQGLLKWAIDQAIIDLLSKMLTLQAALPNLTGLLLRCIKTSLDHAKTKSDVFSFQSFTHRYLSRTELEDLTIVEAAKVLTVFGVQHADMFMEPFLNNSNYESYMGKLLRHFQKYFPQESSRWTKYQVDLVNGWVDRFQFAGITASPSAFARVPIEILTPLQSNLEFILLHGETMEIRQHFLEKVFSTKITPSVPLLKTAFWGAFQNFFRELTTCFRRLVEGKQENKEDSKIVEIFNSFRDAVYATGQEMIRNQLQAGHGLSLISISYAFPAATQCQNPKCLASRPPQCSGIEKLNQFLTSRTSKFNILPYANKLEYDCIRLTAKAIGTVTCKKVTRHNSVELQKYYVEPQPPPRRPGDPHRYPVTVSQHNDAVKSWNNFRRSIGEAMPVPVARANVAASSSLSAGREDLDSESLSGQKRRATDPTLERDMKRMRSDAVETAQSSGQDESVTANNAASSASSTARNKPVAKIVLEDDD